MQHNKNWGLKELKEKITLLNSEKDALEETLEYQFTNVISSLNPIVLLKDSVAKLAEDEEIKMNISNFALKTVGNFFIEKVLGTNRSIKGYISSVIIEKLSEKFLNKLTQPKN